MQKDVCERIGDRDYIGSNTRDFHLGNESNGESEYLRVEENREWIKKHANFYAELRFVNMFTRIENVKVVT